MRAWLVSGIVAAISLVARAAHADLVYEAPSSCPDAKAFATEIAARTTHANDDPRTLHVRIAEESGGFVGHLHLESDGTPSSPRAVEAASCAEVVDALALVAALAVEAHAKEQAAASEPEPAKPAEPPLVVAPAKPDTREPRDADATSHARGPRETRLRAGAQAAEAALSGGVFSVRAFADVTFRDRAKLVAPSVRLAFSRSADADRVVPPAGRATLTWTEGSIEGCPLRVALGGGVSLRPCTELILGVLEGSGSGVSSARDRSRPWAELDVHGRVGWDVLDWLAIEAEGGPTVPLVREQFVFNPGVGVYQAPIIALFGRAGVAVRFR